MILCITATGKTLDAQVDPRFGRAAFFIIYDTEAKAFEAVENKQRLDAPQGAGVQSAAAVVKTGATAVLTGNCGPKAFRVLEAGNVAVYIGLNNMTVQQAIDQFLSGGLQPAGAANVEGHWA